MAQVSDQIFLPDERIVDVAPRLTPRVGDPHVRRLNFVPGRSLTADALKLERTYWDTQTALLGRAVNPGIVTGLEVELLDDLPESAAVRVTAGRGITDLGQDITLPRTLSARIADIPAAEPLIEATLSPVGLVGLFLKPVRAVSANVFDPEDPCPVDPEAYTYDDLVTQDVVELVWARLDSGPLVERPEGDDLLRPVRPVGGAEGEKAVLGPLSSTNVLLPPAPLLGQPNPRLVPTSVYRSIVAARLIAQEEDANRRGVHPPWSGYELPVAIAQITEKGHVLFLDRFAVARAGGAVRQPSTGPSFGLTTSLRKARFDQFLDHLQGLRAEGAALAPATLFFRTLPSVGVLPATLFNTKLLTCGFFPQNFVIEAAPIQLAQMEAILATRAVLAPFDLARRDYVQLLVPVPDHLFDPRLLIQEDLDEASKPFLNAITEAELREAQKRIELDQLDAIEAFITGLVDMETAAGKSDVEVPDESAAGQTKKETFNILFELEEQFESVPLSADEEKALSRESFDEAATAILNGKEPIAGFKGLKPFVEDLSQQLDTANDHADMGFLRLQSDMFRVRKQLGGEDDATRLATSPVLANLATNTTGLESSKLFANIVKEPPKPSTQLKYTTAVPQVMMVASAMTTAGAPQPSATMRLASSMVSESLAAKYQPAPSYTAVFTSSFGKSITPIEPVRATAVTQSPTELAQIGLAGIKANLQNSILQASDIAWASVIYGKASPIRTATIAERLRPSPAQEAKNSAVATKAEIVRGIQDLGLNLEGLPLPVSAARVTLIPVSAREEMISDIQNTGDAMAEVAKLLAKPNAMPVEGDVAVLSDKHLLTVTALEFPRQNDQGETDPFHVAIYKAMETVAGQLYDARLGLDHENLAGLILADRLDPDPDDPDEAAFFAAAVDALESAVSILRLFENRVQSYTAFLELVRTALVDALDLSEEWQGTIDEVQAEIDEAQHDQAVAYALMVEERARLTAINEKRRDILDKHVDIVAFARPMTVNRLTNAPGMPLFRPLAEVLPACLESDADLPDELEEILEAMRDAPVGWYPEIAVELKKLRRPEHYVAAWQRGLDRAGLWLARNTELQPRIQYSGTQTRAAGKAATGVYLALSGLLAQRKSLLLTRTQRTIGSLKGASWSSLHDVARDELSIEDLEQGGKAGRDVARKGAKMLGQIGSVAGCFLSGLRETPAPIRLVWAEQFSEHDSAVDLSDLSAVPGWSAIPLAERRELEVMHGWLFARIDRDNEDALGMMSTLIRVCLLMSSHAPVSSIVEGAVVETKNVTPGQSFEVDVGLGRPAIGMVATIGQGAFAGRGVIEDIVASRALVRVTDMVGPRISLTAQEAVTFSAPVSIKLADVKV